VLEPTGRPAKLALLTHSIPAVPLNALLPGNTVVMLEAMNIAARLI